MASKDPTIWVSGKSITLKNLLEQIEKTKRQRDELETQIEEMERKLNGMTPKYISLEIELNKLQYAHEIFNLKQKINNFDNNIEQTEEKIYPWSEQVQDVLNNVFKFKEFRPKQKSAIDIVLNLKDLLVVMPTGGGKSLLYQLPAYIEKGFSIVVSPLKSLINDQIRIMKQIKLNAVALNTSTSAADKKIIFKQMLDKKSDLKLIYVSSKWLAENETFLNQLQKAEKADRLKRIVIDEIHCCSELSHDFREDYEYLSKLRKIFPKIPFLGLTATATIYVLHDIQNMLCMKNSMVITDSFNRPNLYYKTVYKSPSNKESVNQICDLLVKYTDQTGIIYCNTIQESIDLTKDLRSRGYKCDCYHAEMTADDKERIYNKWMNKEFLFVIATQAFDIGIDMPDVRFVIHYCLPRSIANLYQETGRAGRDGQRSDCIIMYNLFDYLNIAKDMGMPYQKRKNLLKMFDYCLNDYCCKRKLIFNYFEEEWHQDQCKQMCDYCEQPSATNLIDITHYYKRICKILNDTSDEKLKLNILLDIWLTGRFKSNLSREDAEYIIAHLMIREYLGILVIFSPNESIDYIVKGNEYFNEKIIIKTSRVFNSTKKRRNVNYKTKSARKMKLRK